MVDFRRITCWLTLLALFAMLETKSATAQTADRIPPPTIGRASILAGVNIRGARVVAGRSRDDSAPLIVRIVRCEPAPDGFTYDLEYYGLEAGDYDLAEYLAFADKSANANIPSIPVAIVSSFAKTPELDMRKTEFRNIARTRLYSALWWGFVALWCVGLIAILAFRPAGESSSVAPAAELTAWEKLKQRIECGTTDELTIAEKAEIERLAYVVLCQREFAGMETSLAVQHLRQAPNARAAIQEFEQWLHVPNGGSIDFESAFAWASDQRDALSDQLDREETR